MKKYAVAFFISLCCLGACSKNSSGSTTIPPPPPPSCSSSSECIVGSWNIQASSAKLKDGTLVPLYSSGANNNLLDFSGWQWQFTDKGKWKEYLNGSFLNDTGTYHIAADDTLYLEGTIPHVFIIADINKATMNGYFIYDHAHPDSLGTKVAFEAGIDTANFDGTTASWSK